MALYDWLIVAASIVFFIVFSCDYFSTSNRRFRTHELDTEYGVRYEIVQTRTGLFWFKLAEDRRWSELVCYSSEDKALTRIRELLRAGLDKFYATPHL